MTLLAEALYSKEIYINTQEQLAIVEVMRMNLRSRRDSSGGDNAEPYLQCLGNQLQSTKQVVVILVEVSHSKLRYRRNRIEQVDKAVAARTPN